jgi:hypothetical protein
LIEVVFNPPAGDTKWDRWIRDVEKAKKRLLAQASKKAKLTISNTLYKRTRDIIFDAFHGKCIYCEAKFALDQSGDVEHYRPKAGVVDENDQVVTVSSAGGLTAAHRGYYWLAYDYRNLFPSCLKCNRPSKNRAGKLVGKGTRFPVRGFRASEPGEETKENPLLLLPIGPGFNPANHFNFDPRTGIIGGKTDEGRTTIRLLDLNREGLPEERRDVYTGVSARLVAVNKHLIDLMRTDDAKLKRALADNIAVLRAYRLGHKPYCLAARKALEDHPELVGHLPRTRPLTTDRLFLSSRGLRLTGPGRNGHAQAK